MAILKFYRGIENSYNSGTHANGIYFCTDTGKIMLDGKQYGGADTGKTVKDAELIENKLKITYTDNSNKEIDLGKLLTYKSAIESKDLQMPAAVGGIAKGTTVEELEAKNYNQIFDDLLFPTVKPTFTKPSASLSLKGYQEIVEVGTAGPDLSTNFTTDYNPGAINLNGQEQADRAGALKPEESFIYVGDSEDNKTTPETIPAGNTKFTYKASYEAGPQPKDNKGNNFDSPLAAGSVKSAAVTINGTYPYYATTQTAGTLTKQSLLSWNTSGGQMTTPGLVLQPHTTEQPQQFKIPRTLSQLQMLNTVSNQMEVISSSDWSMSSAEENDWTYYTYTYTGSNRGSVTLILKF